MNSSNGVIGAQHVSENRRVYNEMAFKSIKALGSRFQIVSRPLMEVLAVIPNLFSNMGINHSLCVSNWQYCAH